MANHDTPQPAAYGMAEFARLHGISRGMAYKELEAGRLRTFRIGRRRLVSRQAAEEWLEAPLAEAETAA